MAEPSGTANRSWASIPWRLIALCGFLVLLVWKVLMPRGTGAATAPTQATPIPTDVAMEPLLAGTATSGHEHAEVAFEPTDWPLGAVALIYFGTLVLLVISVFALIAAYPNSLRDVSRTLRIAPPGPHLQTDPAGDLRRFRAEEEKLLDSYYWVDRDKGIVHIPIEEAMRKLAAIGVPGLPEDRQ